MKKIFLIAVMSVMAWLGAAAQQKGPAVIETENFSVKVPKGWIVKEQKSGSISSVSLVPEVKPKESTNFGYGIDIWSFVSRTYTAEKIIDEALKRYGENAVLVLGDNVLRLKTLNVEGSLVRRASPLTADVLALLVLLTIVFFM